ncbi:MAG: fatty acid desaturase, partial [Actinomycetota bacterium]|nr:fatty acid desaturase [Actinomycetota bacterium]
RNVWVQTITYCGHFPDGAETFTQEQFANESRGGRYVRQLLGSCNLEGSPLFHLMTGHLSFQIEHHLFPALPSNRYPEIAPLVRAVCQRYGLPYSSGRLGRQYLSAVKKIARFALPPRQLEGSHAGGIDTGREVSARVPGRGALAAP